MQLELVVAKAGGQGVSKRARGVLSSRGSVQKNQQAGICQMCSLPQRQLCEQRQPCPAGSLSDRDTQEEGGDDHLHTVLPEPTFQHHLARVKQAKAQKQSGSSARERDRCLLETA